MKVCIVKYSFCSGLLRDASAHVERGDEVDVICLRRPGEDQQHFTDINVHGLFERKFDEKHPLHYLWKLVKFWLLSFCKISIFHLKKRYDLIYIISPPDFMVFVALIPRLLGAKVILNIHDIVPEFYMRKFGVQGNHFVIKALKFIERISARFSNHVFTVTDIWKTTLVSRSVPGSKCSVLLNAPDTKIFNRANKGEMPKSGRFTLLYPGNLDFGVDVLIKSMQLISQEIPDVVLKIHGEGSQRTKLIKLAEDIGVSKFINFNEVVSSHELARIMQNVDVGVDPMRGGVFFGDVLSVKSLEFLAMGIPVVISRTKASQYYYDGSMVMFFKPESHEDLARAVIELYKNPQKRIELANNAKKFNAIHNWEHYKKLYYKIVDSLCSKAQYEENIANIRPKARSAQMAMARHRQDNTKNCQGFAGQNEVKF